MIKKIAIANFKSIRALELSLNVTNILIGANGVGKSNFISFFKMLRSLKSNTLNKYVAEQGYMDNLVNYGLGTGIPIWGELSFSKDNETLIHTYAFSLKPDNKNLAIIDHESSTQWTGGDQTLGQGYTNYNQTDQSIHLVREDQAVYKLTTDYFDTLNVYHFHDTSADSPLKKTARVHDNLFLREDGSNLAAFLYYLQEKHPQRLNLIEKVIRSIAPFFGQFNLHPDRLNEEYIQLEWKEIGYDRYQNVQNLSDGTLRFIALTALMLQPNPPKVIIIDEPELGLHPSAITMLAGLIRKVTPKSQVILSTQSIQLVNEFEPEDIIVVDRKNEQSEFKRLDSDKLQIWLEEYGLGEIWYKGIIGGKP